MAKLFIILIVAAIIESVGVAFLSGGLKEIEAPSTISVSGIMRVIKGGATNPKILLGITLEAVFFGCLLYMLKQNEVSLVWPLTSLGFIVTTLSAAIFLKESVSWQRWFGVFLIALGAGIIGFAKSAEDKKAALINAPTSAPLSPK